ncbi:MAG: TonB-dependent receptor [Bacteroidetes bacterium]|nr:TonB-dependent receptor [Bacteroidota bacterium]
MTRRFWLLFNLLILVPLLTYAHPGPIQTGTVSAGPGQKLDQVYVVNFRTGFHDHTDESGRFTLPDCQAGDSLGIYRLGYFSQVVHLKSVGTPLDIILQPSPIVLDQLVVNGSVNPLRQVAEIDMKVSPVANSQELLRKTPGLFIGQHAGGGKAEQLFMRGFDVDHGTDVAISVDNMPVNMVSHAHGQGYADLHFVIPETIGKIDFGKGPYYADRGNFNTAGYVNLETLPVISQNLIAMEAGQFNSYRMVGLLNLLPTDGIHRAYLAVENVMTDGAFDSPQQLSRTNWFLKYSGQPSSHQHLILTASRFASRWDASGQIPERAVKSGAIGWFGAIDDTEGGSTSRSNLQADHLFLLDAHSFIKTSGYLSQYDFDLYSNFTFFLIDSLNGDQIRQKETRLLSGVQSVYHASLRLGDWEVGYRAGAGFRTDEIDDIGLTHTKDRLITLDTLAISDIVENNWFGFADAEFDYGDWKLNPALRIDYFRFTLLDAVKKPFGTQSFYDTRFSPKFNVIYTPTDQWQFYLKSGMGFHSNDTRVVASGKGTSMIPIAVGADLGSIWKPIPRLMITTSGWILNLEQEFVYVGDAGVVEPSGKTRRMGFDAGFRYQMLDWLFADADVNYAHARAVGEPAGEDLVPLAPEWTSTGGLTVRHESGWKGTLRYRWMGDRPANEDGTITAEGYVITDLMVGYQTGPWFAELSVDNIFDNDWKETQFATETRLLTEPSPVTDIHFIPGTPRFIRLKTGFEF